ncbi:MAG: hypothetical protein JNJ46_01220 [Myxococcales bacterium]|nr:hypothetical protein [Myxococcales bacterium]
MRALTWNTEVMQRVFGNPLFVIEHDAARKLVIIRRQALSLDLALTDETHRDALAKLRPLRGQRLLTDLRLVPGSNSPSVEAKAQLLRRDLRELFPVHATLVASAVGRLQVLRMARERGEPNMAVFLSEEEAVAHLMTIPV